MKFAPLAAFLAGIALSAAPAFAHDDAQLDKAKNPNGGQLRHAGLHGRKRCVVT